MPAAPRLTLLPPCHKRLTKSTQHLETRQCTRGAVTVASHCRRPGAGRWRGAGWLLQARGSLPRTELKVCHRRALLSVGMTVCGSDFSWWWMVLDWGRVVVLHYQSIPGAPGSFPIHWTFDNITCTRERLNSKLTDQFFKGIEWQDYFSSL